MPICAYFLMGVEVVVVHSKTAVFAEAEVECCSCAGWLCHSGWLGIGRSHADSAAEQKRLKIEPASPLPARYITVSVVTLR